VIVADKPVAALAPAASVLQECEACNKLTWAGCAAWAQIFPEVVNQLTPDGSMQGDSDEVPGQGITALEQFLSHLRARW